VAVHGDDGPRVVNLATYIELQINGAHGMGADLGWRTYSGGPSMADQGADLRRRT